MVKKILKAIWNFLLVVGETRAKYVKSASSRGY